jgi:hypothetical protein
MDDCENLEPTPDNNALAMALSATMSGFFTDETARAFKFRDLLQKHHIDLRATNINGTKYATDGDVQYKGFRYAIAEIKNEIGSSSADPHMQVLLYYIHSTISFATEKPAFRFPCIAITLFGGFLVFHNSRCTDHKFKGHTLISQLLFGARGRTCRRFQLLYLCFITTAIPYGV